MSQAPTPLDAAQTEGKRIHAEMKSSNALMTLVPEVAGSIVTELDRALEELAIEMVKASGKLSSSVRLPSDISGKARTTKTIGKRIEAGEIGKSRYPQGSTEVYINAYMAIVGEKLGLPASTLAV